MSALEAHVVVRRDDFLLDVELSVPAGTTAAIVGPNGAGKSTTLNALAGIEPMTRTDHDDGPIGRIELNGKVLDDPGAAIFVPPRLRNVGMVFQDNRLFAHMSVHDNVAFSARARGQHRREARHGATHWLEQLDLAELADRRPAELSGGQAQRVAMARALASEPDLLLFDEPLSALDVAARTELRRVLRTHLDGFAGPRMIVTHDPADAFLLADQLHVIENGRVTQVGTPDEIRRRPATPYVAALAGTNLFAGTARAGRVNLDEHVHEFTIADTTLDGPVVITVHPRTVSLHPRAPEGSQRNTWATRVDLLEPMGDTVRVTLNVPIPLAVDVTPGAVAALELAPGMEVWAAVKATEISATTA